MIVINLFYTINFSWLEKNAMNQNKYFTGVGSRETPNEICEIMKLIGKKLDERGWILRSGGAKPKRKSNTTFSADLSFEALVKNKYIYTVRNFDFSEPNYSFCRNEVISVLDKHLNLDNNYDKFCQTLLLRDINQVLGSPKTSTEKSKFLICWTKSENYNDSSLGGTRIAVRCALKHGIKVYNLVNNSTLEMIKKRLEL